MGRLTEVIEIVRNGFSSAESFHWINPDDPKTRNVLKKLRKENTKETTKETGLFD